jgi:hypothetical protein
VQLNTGKTVNLKKDCGHLQFADSDEDDDVVHFDAGKFAKKRCYKNKEKSFSWVYEESDLEPK